MRRRPAGGKAGAPLPVGAQRQRTVYDLCRLRCAQRSHGCRCGQRTEFARSHRRTQDGAVGCATGKILALTQRLFLRSSHVGVRTPQGMMIEWVEKQDVGNNIQAALGIISTAEEAQQHLSDCHLCPHRCGPVRAIGRGICRVGQVSYIASEMLHLGEEELLRPAHAIFFSGCTATCSFCTAAKFAFRPTYGVVVSPAQLAGRIVQRQEQGARSICFIGGDPAPHIPFVLATLAELGERKQIPAVFNSNFFLTDEALDLLDGAIDIYLPDLKFGPSTGPQSCGERVGGMPGYWRAVTGCLDRLYEEGKRLVVRHLLMPGHFDCCTVPVLHWLAERPRIEVSLLTQYLAPAHAKGELAARLTSTDVEQAYTLARQLHLSLVR
ncbi:MAG: hypothetical protein DCC55_11720 [Chloroflexi bacterium]|nr:MAG: hypothetical protein DCC55_11720 [Chloroflexota bacterium]